MTGLFRPATALGTNLTQSFSVALIFSQLFSTDYIIMILGVCQFRSKVGG